MSIQGLTSIQAKRILATHGPNELPENTPPSDFSIMISQLKSPLVYVLIAAALVTLFLGHYTDAIVILFAIAVNTILGYIQERRANNALGALKKLIHPTAIVVRDGKQMTIDAAEIVPGDLCIINTGDKVTADGVLIEANRLFVNESMLTGESVAVNKDDHEKVFMGTIVTSGRGQFLVESTGKDTEIGKIAVQVQDLDIETPLRKQTRDFSKKLTMLVLVLISFVFLMGIISGKDAIEIFTTSVALAVSAIPEGLLVGLTAVLAIGMQRILKQKGLVKSLLSAETLGGVTTICVDKTGTLTKGEMTLTDFLGDKNKLALQALVANDLDDPMLIAARDWAKNNGKFKMENGNLESEYFRLDSIPFSSTNRYFACLSKYGDKNIVFVNGAPDKLLSLSTLRKNEIAEIEERIRALTTSGARVIAMAQKTVSVSKKSISSKDIRGIEWVGALAFSDPVRDSVKTALEKTSKAGVKTIVITGDYGETAKSVLTKLGIDIKDEEMLLGSELAKMSKTDLCEMLIGKNRIKLFARTTPDQKLKIVEALKSNGEVVAMMGDGVNDAPALSKADIGIVVGGATDVAKESADLILLDSSFSTIVAAIEEGRGIFDNIRKIILYLMSDAFSEIVAVVGTIIFGLPLAVTAAQILWINLVSDGFPSLALTADPKRYGIMNEPPRPPIESLINGWMKRLVSIVSIAGGLAALALFVYYYRATGDIVLAQSIAFATLGINSLFYVFSIRTLTRPFWKQNPFENKWLNIAVLAGFGLQMFPFVTQMGRSFLGVSQLNAYQWLVIFATSTFMFIMIESLKAFVPKKSN